MLEAVRQRIQSLREPIVGTADVEVLRVRGRGRELVGIQRAVLAPPVLGQPATGASMAAEPQLVLLARRLAAREAAELRLPEVRGWRVHGQQGAFVAIARRVHPRR